MSALVPLDWDPDRPLITVKGFSDEDYRRLAKLVLEELERRHK